MDVTINPCLIGARFLSLPSHLTCHPEIEYSSHPGRGRRSTSNEHPSLLLSSKQSSQIAVQVETNPYLLGHVCNNARSSLKSVRGPGRNALKLITTRYRVPRLRIHESAVSSSPDHPGGHPSHDSGDDGAATTGRGCAMSIAPLEIWHRYSNNDAQEWSWVPCDARLSTARLALMVL